MSGPELALAALAVAALAGLSWHRRQGRLSATGTAALPAAVRARLDDAAAVTLLQLTTPICARCPQARTLLTELAAVLPGVRHTELDLTVHPELVEELGVRATPTTLAVSPTGHELFRVTGVPQRTELLSALQAHL
ncbi:MAG TPA: thioredoxin domain-containing protein [Pseudonocardiaceae bacterium]|jgi:thiol-disulfide isomerase/thioredoxin|nr:thioredoxin domain-containing protein [Pseudonocardiaceae bacterium]